MSDLTITASDRAALRYFITRMAPLIVWDIYNLNPPAEKQLITLSGASDHFYVQDRDSCIVAAPKDLYTHDRTQHDAYITAVALANEIFQRSWSAIELTGNPVMVSVAYVALQVLAEINQRPIDILHHEPSEREQQLITQGVSIRRGQAPDFNRKNSGE